MATDPNPTEKGATDHPAEPGSGNDELNTQRWREAADALRSRVDLTAKALGGVGTTAITAVGIAKIGDLFPVPDGAWNWVWFALAIVGFVALAASVLIVTYRLWSVNQPLLMRADPDSMKDQGDVDDAECQEVALVYQETADLNDASTLKSYEARANRLTRIAARTADDPERARLEALVKQIRGDIQETFARAVLRLMRRRTSNAVRGAGSLMAYGLFVIGILLFALGTDYVTSGRSEEITIATNCAAARTAGATTLPPICGGGAAAAAAKTSPAEERAKAAAALSGPLASCLALITAGEAPAGSCDDISNAMSSLAAPPP